MPDPVTPAERREFQRLVPVTLDPARRVVRVAVPGGWSLCIRSARILAALLLEAAERADAPDGRCSSCGWPNRKDGTCTRPGCCNDD